MTRDRFDIFVQHCVDVGLTVTWADLGSKRRGHCCTARHEIVLSPRLTMAQAASTGMHEFAHWAYGDVESTPAAERRAWEYGASLLFEVDEYRTAERLVGHHTSALAIELGVTPQAVEAWRRWWEKRGQHLAAVEAQGD